MFADAVEAVLLFLEGFLSHYSEMIYLNLAADLFLHSMFWELFCFSMNMENVNTGGGYGERGLQIVCADSERAVITNGGLFFSSQLAVSAPALTRGCVCVCSCNTLAPVQRLGGSNSVRTSHKTLRAVWGLLRFFFAKQAGLTKPREVASLQLSHVRLISR